MDDLVKKRLIKLLKALDKLNTRISKDPLLFYGKTGKELIQVSKELHILGSRLLRSERVQFIKILFLMEAEEKE